MLRLLSKKKARHFRRTRIVSVIAEKLDRRRGVARPGPLVLVGLFSSSTGLGSAARRLAVSLRRMGHEVYTIDFTNELGITSSVPWVDRPPPNADGGTLVFCFNPNEVALFLSRGGLAIAAGKKLVGYWWWELERIPDNWHALASKMDELWCSSRFVYECFARSQPGKIVRYIPMTIEAPVSSGKSLADFGLLTNAFTVLCVFDFKSFARRKNPEGMLQAFRLAFGDRRDVQLVMKVSGTDVRGTEFDALLTGARAYPNVRFIDTVLSEGDLASLVQGADVVLSLHRSEGFGLVPAEAMLLGTAVVATGWSGVLDFLSPATAGLVGYRLVPVLPGEYLDPPAGCRWAEPDVAEAAEWLRKLESDIALRAALSGRAREAAARIFCQETFQSAVSIFIPVESRG